MRGFGDFGFGFGLRSGGVSGGSPTPTPSAPMASIDASGWKADYAATPSVPAPVAFTASRQGYDATGTAATITETMYVTQRVRQPFPNQASLTALTTAMSDYIYSTDTIAGVTNNSTETSPKPIANWAMIDQKVIGNTIGGTAAPVEIVAFHRNGVAAVKFIITDGTNTVNVTVSTPTVSTTATDQHAVIVYALPSTSISGLTDQSVVTINAEVYPRIGGSASVIKSVDSAVTREFSPRYFFKHTTKAASPVYVYANATTGVDATVLASGATSGGIQKVSTNPATAAANPFATLNSANTALKAATTLTGGVTNGCIMRVQGTQVLSSNWSSADNQATNNGALIIEGDPTDSTATISFGGATTNIRNATTIYRAIKFLRTGALSLASPRLENVQIDNASFNNPLATTQNTINGATITNGASAMLSTGVEQRLLRGINASGAAQAVEGYLVLGNLFNNGATYTDISTRTMSGGVVAFNRGLRIGSNPLDAALSWSISNWALVQNVFEFVSTSALYNRISGDSGVGNTDHILVWNNTIAGFDQYARSNFAYTDGTFASGAQSRVHKRWSVRGNIFTQMNVKSDTFVGINQGDTTNAPNAIGNWSVRYSVGWIGNMTQYAAADGTPPGQGSSFNQDYAGLKANSGTSNTVRNDPLFTDYRATTNTGSTPVAGTGGGTYTLQTGSPAIGVLVAAEEALPFDLTGAARDRGTIGAYR